MNKISNILVSAGTHGNELSGIAFVNYYKNSSDYQNEIAKRYPSLSLDMIFTNEQAIEARTRFCEEDLNRQFTPERLSQLTPESSEHALALKLDAAYGPKGNSKTDLVIDIHNTTSNMGATLILLESDEFHKELASFVKARMPDAVILVEDEKPYNEHKYFCTVGKKGVMIEVGAQAQGVLRAKAYQQTQALCEAILLFCEHYNTAQLPNRKKVEAFRLIEEVSFPTDSNNNISAMIHPDFQDKDFELLSQGMPMFLGFDGMQTNYQSERDVYPHFIGEAAYYHLGIAFATAEKFEF